MSCTCRAGGRWYARGSLCRSLLACLALLVVTAAPAFAQRTRVRVLFPPEQASVAGSVGMAGTQEYEFAGPSLELRAALEVTLWENNSLRLQVGRNRWRTDPPPPSPVIPGDTAGLTHVTAALVRRARYPARVHPYAAFGLGAYRFSQKINPGRTVFRPGGYIGLGGDVILNPDLAIATEVQLHFIRGPEEKDSRLFPYLFRPASLSIGVKGRF